jgi:AraC family transcriptional regulator of arabinose operon
MEQAAAFFNEHYNNNINIDTYAASKHMSTCWFIRRFKQVTGVTPLQYIITLRMTNAKVLLEAHNYNVAQTAHTVGYDNPLYFSRLFTKFVGLSPSEYKHLQNK